MKQPTAQTDHIDLPSLAAEAQVLLEATTDVADEKVAEARQRLSAAIDKGRATWNQVQDRAAASAKAADQAIREHPYQSIGIAFGVGALIGFLASRRK